MRRFAVIYRGEKRRNLIGADEALLDRILTSLHGQLDRFRVAGLAIESLYKPGAQAMLPRRSRRSPVRPPSLYSSSTSITPRAAATVKPKSHNESRVVVARYQSPRHGAAKARSRYCPQPLPPGQSSAARLKMRFCRSRGKLQSVETQSRRHKKSGTRETRRGQTPRWSKGRRFLAKSAISRS